MNDKLTELQIAILHAIRSEIPNLKTCAEHPIEETKPSQKRLPIELPAVFVTQTELEAEPSDGTSRLKVKSRWQAVSVVTGLTATERNTRARELILAVSDVIFESRFGVKAVEPAQIERLKPYDVENELKLLAGAWVLTWTHGVFLYDQQF